MSESCMFNIPLFADHGCQSHLTWDIDRVGRENMGGCDNPADEVFILPKVAGMKCLHVHLCAEHAAYYKDCIYPLEAQYGKELAECRAEQKRVKARKPALKSRQSSKNDLATIAELHAQIAKLQEEITALKSKPAVPIDWKSGIVKAREIAFNRSLAKAI